MRDELDDASDDVAEQRTWGDGLYDRALAKLVAWMSKARDRLEGLEADRDTAKSAIQDLRTRVKALEDKVP